MAGVERKRHKNVHRIVRAAPDDNRRSNACMLTTELNILCVFANGVKLRNDVLEEMERTNADVAVVIGDYTHDRTYSVLGGAFRTGVVYPSKDPFQEKDNGMVICDSVLFRVDENRVNITYGDNERHFCIDGEWIFVSHLHDRNPYTRDRLIEATSRSAVIDSAVDGEPMIIIADINKNTIHTDFHYDSTIIQQQAINGYHYCPYDTFYKKYETIISPIPEIQKRSIMDTVYARKGLFMPTRYKNMTLGEQRISAVLLNFVPEK